MSDFRVVITLDMSARDRSTASTYAKAVAEALKRTRHRPDEPKIYATDVIEVRTI